MAQIESAQHVGRAIKSEEQLQGVFIKFEKSERELREEIHELELKLAAKDRELKKTHETIRQLRERPAIISAPAHDVEELRQLLVEEKTRANNAVKFAERLQRQLQAANQDHARRAGHSRRPRDKADLYHEDDQDEEPDDPSLKREDDSAVEEDLIMVSSQPVPGREAERQAAQRRVQAQPTRRRGPERRAPERRHASHGAPRRRRSPRHSFVSEDEDEEEEEEPYRPRPTRRRRARRVAQSQSSTPPGDDEESDEDEEEDEEERAPRSSRRRPPPRRRGAESHGSHPPHAADSAVSQAPTRPNMKRRFNLIEEDLTSPPLLPPTPHTALTPDSQFPPFNPAYTDEMQGFPHPNEMQVSSRRREMHLSSRHSDLQLLPPPDSMQRCPSPHDTHHDHSSPSHRSKRPRTGDAPAPSNPPRPKPLKIARSVLRNAFNFIFIQEHHGLSEIRFHEAIDMTDCCEDLWERISLCVDKWEDRAGEEWQFEFTKPGYDWSRPACVTSKFLHLKGNWREGCEGMYACGNCVKEGRPCFTWKGREREFWLLPLHPQDRRKAVEKNREIRYWVNA